MSNKCSRSRVTEGFVHTDGTRMLNGKGEQIVLRGWGAGNWTNPEGFMVGGTQPFGGAYNQAKLLDRARSMEWLVQDLCGTEYNKRFWPQWYRKHLGEADIQAMADLGYNSVRLVLNAAAFLYEEPGITFNEDSFAMLDDVLDWCEKYQVYAILDMHAAPGGQSCGGCDNARDNVPHLFLDEESWERAIRLWEEFARRYQDRWIVAGYDLLNEPLNAKEWFHLTPKLQEFYEECIRRIRAIDRNHMLTLEGTLWATQVSVFDRDYDPECHNWCIHIHNYGYTPEIREVQAMLERSRELNVPIWMGEGGSNNTANTIFLEMLAQEGIGFALWCWKTAEKTNGEASDTRDCAPAEYQLPEGWQQVFEYADHGGPKPGYEKSQRIFDELLENLDYKKCRHPEVRHQYVLRQPGITIPGAGYDHGKAGEAFLGHWEGGNAFEYRLGDRVKLVVKPGGKRQGPQEMKGFVNSSPFEKIPAEEELWPELSTGEFVHYTIRDVKEDCPVTLQVRALCDSVLIVSVGGQERRLELSKASGQETGKMEALTLPQGEAYAVRVEVEKGTIQIASVEFGAKRD